MDGGVSLGNVGTGGQVGNRVLVSGKGYLKGVATVATYNDAVKAPLTIGNVVEVTDGGILEGAFTVGPATYACGAGNAVTNHNGGVYQFTIAAPTLTLRNGGAAYITDGVISFRAITDANVQGSKTLAWATNLAWAGANAFRLNNATNVTSPSQTYTFGPGLGPTNYVRLELMNGALYRGGDVTIANGGELRVMSERMGTNAVLSGQSAVTNLTVQSGGKLRIDLGAGTNSYGRLRAIGTVTWNAGAAFEVVSSHPPVFGYEYLVVDKTSAGAIAGLPGTVDVAVGGTNYSMRVNAAAGDSNDVVLRYTLPTGTVFSVR